jgi:hypothetical protein
MRLGHPRFEVHTQTIRDAIDVIEIGDGLRGVVYGAIGEAQGAQVVDIGAAHRVRCAGQLDCVITQGAVHFTESGLRVIRLDHGDQLIVLDLRPEIVGVGLRSVVTVIGTRNHDGEHFALGASQGRLPAHHGNIQVEHSLQGLGVLALDPKNVVDAPGTLPGGLIDFGEFTARLVVIDHPNPSHGGNIRLATCFSTLEFPEIDL